MIRWPVDETGRNSVTPSTTPRSTASPALNSAAGGADVFARAAPARTSERSRRKKRGRTAGWFQFWIGGANLFVLYLALPWGEQSNVLRDSLPPCLPAAATHVQPA